MQTYKVHINTIYVCIYVSCMWHIRDIYADIQGAYKYHICIMHVAYMKCSIFIYIIHFNMYFSYMTYMTHICKYMCHIYFLSYMLAYMLQVTYMPTYMLFLYVSYMTVPYGICVLKQNCFKKF